MDNNLTIDTLVFNLRYSDKSDGSERRETSRGVNLPEIMTVKHRDIVDTKTKKSSTQSVLRFDRMLALSDGTIAGPEAHIVVTCPKDTNVTSADILAVIQRLVTVLQEDDSGLDLANEIFVNLEQ